VSRQGLVVVIPAYNEEATLPAVLDALGALELDAEIVVVDDASTDHTAAVAATGGATVLRHPYNLGYGAALQTGYKYALERGAETVAQMDADGQHDPAQLASLLQPIRSGEADLVIGSRFLKPTDYRMGSLRSLGRRVFGGIARLAGLAVTDPTSGFQAMGRPVLELYVEDIFPSDYPDVDVLLMVHRHGLTVVDRPVEMRAELRPSTLHGGFRAFYYVYKMLLSVFAGAGSPRRDR
jgi:glycosyltransferase involved in cell wall biosynthesis